MIKIKMMFKCTSKCLTHNTIRWNSSSLSLRNVTPFQIMVKDQKQTAKKYIIIEERCGSLRWLSQQYLQQLFDAKIESLWRYQYNKKSCALIQFETEMTDHQLSQFTVFSDSAFPIKTRMLVMNSMTKLANQKTRNDDSNDIIQLSSPKDDSKLFDVSELRRLFNTNEQILSYLLNERIISEIAIKLRFFVLSQLERLICEGPYREFCLLPFGSSLSGLGTCSSDLDIVMLPSSLSSQSSISSRKLSYADREMRLERVESQRNLEILGDLIQHLIPNFVNVTRILRARIPILKFKFDLAPIDIDLSFEVSRMSAHHGVLMASYLSLCASESPLVLDLTTFVRIWAKHHSITKSTPGHWFTNFQLTMIVIYFLQRKMIVPPMSVILELKSAKPSIVKQESDVNFIELLREFFEFLLTFKYNTKAISILSGNLIPKPDYAPIYIENPLERELNICKNVISLELEKLLSSARSSHEMLSSNNYHIADIIDPVTHNKRPISKLLRIKAEHLINES